MLKSRQAQTSYISADRNGEECEADLLRAIMGDGSSTLFSASRSVKELFDEDVLFEGIRVMIVKILCYVISSIENRINMAALILVIYSETRMVVSIIKIISGSIRSGVVSHISKQMVKLIFFYR